MRALTALEVISDPAGVEKDVSVWVSSSNICISVKGALGVEQAAQVATALILKAAVLQRGGPQ